MAVVNAIELPEGSPFRQIDQVPLPEDPALGTQAKGQEKDSSNDDEGRKNPESWELSKQIDSHVVVLDEEQLRTEALVFTQIVQAIDLQPSNPPTAPNVPITNSMPTANLGA